ncbi:hypothetical protein L6164_023682 [Bauhinia variegata]|uniref:Uncharacterized protein n=1 Tax=Bauhinia variegata TaxID=167791 RepID=A0ACB9MJJ1_BAUVA|nr:hypothetical protein L6164_023682 [Bauhinia variegata]
MGWLKGNTGTYLKHLGLFYFSQVYLSNKGGKFHHSHYYLINRMPSKVLGNATPYQILFGQPPSLSHLRPFRCLCYDSILPNPDKFKTKTFPAVFLGYPFGKKSYKVLNLQSKQLSVSRDSFP